MAVRELSFPAEEVPPSNSGPVMHSETQTHPKVVAVVGSSGFVGSAVCEQLSRLGHVVVRVRAPRLTLRAAGQGTAEVWRHEDEIEQLQGALKGADAVINAAGLPDALSGDTMDLEAANGVLPGVIAAASRAAAIGRLVHISSAAVQGNVEELDSSSVRRGQTPYARSKALGEDLARKFGPEQTVVYRPAGVHGQARTVTRKLVRLSRSPLASVAGDGSANSPQGLIENVASAAAYLALTPLEPDACVHHPSEQLTVFELQRMLGGKDPHVIPKALARFVIRALTVVERVDPKLGGIRRRLQVMWFGQRQAVSWLERAGWQPQTGLEGWQRLADPGPTQPPRVLTVSSTYEQFRVQYSNHLEIWRKKGYEVYSVVGTSAAEMAGASDFMVHHVSIPRELTLHALVAASRELRRIVRALRPAIVVYGSPAASLVGAIGCIGLVPRRIFVVHGLREETLNGVRRILTISASNLTAWLSTDVVYVSRSAMLSGRRRLLPNLRSRAGWSPPGFVGVEVGAQSSRSGNAHSEATGRCTVGFVGRVARDKGLVELVQAVSMLRDQNCAVELVVVGDQDSSDPVPDSVLRELTTASHIKWLGHLDDPRRTFSTFDLLCLPSYREGLSTVVVEAGIERVPVVATRVTGIVDVLTEDEGWLCDPRSAGALRDTLRIALESMDITRAKAENHHRRMVRDYGSGAVKDWWTEFYWGKNGRVPADSLTSPRWQA